jgi:ribonuclease HII
MHLCGIDEAGRGSFAGPLVVAGVILQHPINGLNDSKQLSPSQRERLYQEIIQSAEYKVVFTDNDTIDSIGLSASIKRSLLTIQEHFGAVSYLFDGNTNFGVADIDTMIKADGKIPEVSAASIIAKVSRDRYMVQISDTFPEYGFAQHKGYGTKAHKEAIKKFGYCTLHRKSVTISGP